MPTCTPCLHLSHACDLLGSFGILPGKRFPRACHAHLPWSEWAEESIYFQSVERSKPEGALFSLAHSLCFLIHLACLLNLGKGIYLQDQDMSLVYMLPHVGTCCHGI